VFDITWRYLNRIAGLKDTRKHNLKQMIRSCLRRVERPLSPATGSSP
jgi:hypothetical protein